MSTILDNNGYVTGPFVIEDGSELWNIGFDWPEDADDALSGLDRDNEFKIDGRTSIDIVDYHEIMQNLESVRDLLTDLWNLTDREQETLLAAVEAGYFETPRATNLGELAEEFDISKSATSKNLRRSQRKVLEQLIALMNETDDGPDSKGISPFDDLVSDLNR
ncbi:helix-turn-helix domain-containing protein [Halocatena marina]|uniref:Helix-turn-helix domain-containing protein n=2 Tax=Halocatena marina TaxID=2934937 RepID=A0ABD5YTT8_9EURY